METDGNDEANYNEIDNGGTTHNDPNTAVETPMETDGKTPIL